MKKTILASLLSLSMFLAVGGVLVSAQGTTAGTPQGGTTVGTPSGGTTVGTKITIDNPFKSGGTLFDLLKAVINNILLPIGGILAVIAFIYSGFLYVTAQGNEANIKKAHTALLYTAVGTAVLLGAWTIANVIENTIDKLKV